MDTKAALTDLQELTLDFVSGKRNAVETVQELHRRIDADSIYKMDEKEPQRDFITQVFVSLDNLLNRDFPPSAAELNYYAEVFAGQREFRLAEVREFEIISKTEDGTEKKERRPVSRPLHSRARKPRTTNRR
ncbi:MAG TPA: hypothetical protein VLH15_08745 [Dehalococcoidales bacterium]|nr:hypothetical protein [Dehalococcoidales bacterium]